MPKPTSINVLLGFDFGMKNLGVAVGQRITATASPLATLRAKDGIPNWDEIAALISHWHAEAIIVGIPINMDGTDQPITHAARRFARRLHNRFHLPVYEMDERLTTVEAKHQIASQDQPHQLDSQPIDSYAAKLILEDWLKQNR